MPERCDAKAAIARQIEVGGTIRIGLDFLRAPVCWTARI